MLLHADDYGETHNTSEEMLELMKGGYLDGFSILTNMREHDRHLRMLLNAIPGMPSLPLINVHVNLVEGRMLSEATADDPQVTDAPCTRWDWMSLCRVSFHLPAHDKHGERMKYRETHDRLVAEIRAQLHRGWEDVRLIQEAAGEAGVPYEPQHLRIDSHQHAHMIPIVRRALEQVIRDEEFEVDYVRNSHELLMPFIRHASCRNLIGTVKNRILALFAPGMEKFIKSLGHTPSYLCGVMMSGHMDAVRLMTVLPDILRKCRQKGYGLEINIHPAMMLETEVTEEIPMESARGFYMSSDRHMEALTVRTIKAAMRDQFDSEANGDEAGEERA